MKLSLYKKYTNVTTLCYNSHGIIMCNILEFLRAKTCVTTAPFFLPPAPKSLGSYFVDNIFFYYYVYVFSDQDEAFKICLFKFISLEKDCVH